MTHACKKAETGKCCGGCTKPATTETASADASVSPDVEDTTNKSVEDWNPIEA